jgi:glycosyltransferase involved in cell wall biosynthesis
MAKHIVCTVTNDLVYDQRMARICTALHNAGYHVTLIGRTHQQSPPLLQKPYTQKRFKCWAQKGKLFYIEYNIKLFWLLLWQQADVYCAIDLDSILPNLWVSKLKRKARVYDAHELFCEMEEISSRPLIYKIWKTIERYAVPQFKNGYTIGHYYAQQFKAMYNVHYSIVRNAAVLSNMAIMPQPQPTYVLYQGAVNKGRSFDTLIPAMHKAQLPLVICGSGNYFTQTQQLIQQHKLQHKISLNGYIAPDKLTEYTSKAYIGITLFSNGSKSLSNYYSMANRFFDYMHAGVPQICVNYPEYARVNEQYKIAILVNDLMPNTIAQAINTLVEDKELYTQMVENCKACRQQYNWQQEEQVLINFYKNLLSE